MQTRFKLFSLCTIAVCFALCLFGCGSSDVKKAQDFIAAGMFPQAIELLSKRVGENPKDAEAQFLLGTCLINTGNISVANDRFTSAMRLKADYGFQIGGEYKKAGFDAVNKGNYSQAQQLFGQAVKYQATLGDEIGGELFNQGKSLFGGGKIDQANAVFLMVKQFSPNRGPDIGSVYYEASKQAQSTSDAVKTLEIANQFGQYSQELQDKKNILNEEKFQILIKKYELQWGSVKTAYLSNTDQQLTVGKVHINSRIHYLSKEAFQIKTNRISEKWDAELNDARGPQFGYPDIEGKESEVSFKMLSKETTVYYWIKES